jgi:hypothetical protein
VPQLNPLLFYRIGISKFALKLLLQKLTRSNGRIGYSSSTGPHGNFLGEIIWRLQHSVETPLAPFLIVKGFLTNQYSKKMAHLRCSLKNGASSMLLKKWRIFDLRSLEI